MKPIAAVLEKLAIRIQDEGYVEGFVCKMGLTATLYNLGAVPGANKHLKQKKQYRITIQDEGNTGQEFEVMRGDRVGLDSWCDKHIGWDTTLCVATVEFQVKHRRNVTVATQALEDDMRAEFSHDDYEITDEYVTEVS